MKKKVAIITHYYKSKNYGGNLQAYALCKSLEKLGYAAEQLSFDPYLRKNTSVYSAFWKFGKRFLKSLNPKVFIANKKEKRIQKLLDPRYKAFEKFNQEMIRHSERVYTNIDINECVSHYDAFVTGSDQVWNFAWYNSAYFLDFVPSEKIKISYAASLAMNDLKDHQKEMVKKHLLDFDAISVREKNAVELLTDLTSQKPIWTLDPTLLLDKSEWECLCTENKNDFPYVFCYFLSDSEEERRIAREYSNKMGYKLVTLPYLNCRARKCDDDFGDIRLFEVSPPDFLTLIKNAECVFTDSFHATVFSILFEKEFFVFGRNDHKAMGTRIDSLLSLIEHRERFFDLSEQIDIKGILMLEQIDYKKEFKTICEEKKRSYDFLKNNLERYNG